MASGSASAGTLRYSINADRWREPYNNQIMTGYASGSTYRAYFTLDLTSYSVVSSVDSASLTIKDTTDYGGSGSVYIGLRTSEPPLGFSTSDYTTNLGTFTITRKQPNTLTLTANSLKAYMGKTVYVCILAASGQYFEFGAGSSSSNLKPSLAFTYTSYTNCGAPTSVSASGIITPSGTFTISWSGATNGTNNKIAKYRIYYAFGSTPTTNSSYKDIDVADGTTSGSTTIKNSGTEGIGAARGKTVYFGVQAIGAVAGYDSGLKTGGSVTINSLPAKPSVTVDRTTVPSTGGTVKFTITAGSDSNTSQTRTLAYSTSTSGAKTIITSPWTSPTIKARTTYYFWTYDGLEYSSDSTSSTIAINTKPVIESLTYNDEPTQLTAFNSNGASGSYFLGWVNSLKPKIKGSKTGTVKWLIEFQPTAGIDSSFSRSKDSSISNFSLTSTSATSMSLINLDGLVKSAYGDIAEDNKYIRWRLKCILNDGIEDSEAKYYPASDKYYAVPGASNAPAQYNQFDNGNINGTVAGHIGKLVRFKLWKDTSVESVSVTIESVKVGTTSYAVPSIASVNSAPDGNYRDVDITLQDTPMSGATITFKIKCYNGSIGKITTATVVECTHLTITGFGLAANTFKPFTADDSTFSITAGWPFGGSEDISTGLAAYECGSDAIKVVFYRGSSQEDVRTGLSYTKSNDLISTSMAKKAVYNWGTLGLASADYKDTYSCRAKLRITNLYGLSFDSNEFTYTLDFRELVQNVQVTSTSCALSGDGPWYSFNLGTSGSIPASAPNALQEGLYLKFTARCNVYTADQLTFNIYRDGSLYASTVVAAAAHATNQTAVAVSADIFTPVTEEITSSSNIVWRIDVANTAGTSSSSDYESAAIQHTSPSGFTLNSCSISSASASSVTVVLSAACSDVGATVTPTYWLYDGTSNVSNSFNQLGNNISVDINSSDWESKSIAVHLQTTTSQSLGSTGPTLTNTKDFYTNNIIIYQLMPTVAYRKNALGINTKALESDSILEIHQNADSINTIKLFGNRVIDNTLTTPKVILNVEEGTLLYNENDADSTLTDKTLVSIYKDGTGMAVGKVAETADLFDVGWPAKFNEHVGVGSSPLSSYPLAVDRSMLIFGNMWGGNAQSASYAECTTTGWYTILELSGSTDEAKGSSGLCIDIVIGRDYSYLNNELHAIKLLLTYNHAVFCNENSTSNFVAIKKIRYVRTDNGTAKVQMYYETASSYLNHVGVSCSIRGLRMTYSFPDPYLDTGSYTVMQEHTFSTWDNGALPVTSGGTGFTDNRLPARNISSAPTDTYCGYFFRVTAAFNINRWDGSTNAVTIPNFTHGVFMASSDAVMLAADSDTNMYWAYRNNGTWRGKQFPASLSDKYQFRQGRFPASGTQSFSNKSGPYNMSIGIPSGYALLSMGEIQTNGFIGSGYCLGNNASAFLKTGTITVSCYVANGGTGYLTLPFVCVKL